MTADEVRLVVPAKPEFLRLARVTAAGLAGRRGFDYDEVEDIRLAIDQMCFAMIGVGNRQGTVELTYRVEGSTIEVRGRALFDPSSDDDHGGELSGWLLDELVDEHQFESGSTPPRFRVVKRRPAPEP